MRHRIIIFPRGVKAVAVSTTIRPVTHTALTDVNNASRKLSGILWALGSINNPDPIKIIIRKLLEKSSAGGIFIELINLANTDISEIAIINIADITGMLPKKKAQNGLLLVTRLKFESSTNVEKRKTRISKIVEIGVFLLKCNNSGRNLVMKSITNSILNAEMSFKIFSSVFENPI